jgi:hypothetical protein
MKITPSHTHLLQFRQFFLQRHGPFATNTYVENVAEQARPRLRAPAGCGFSFVEPT